ncbi:CDP-glucose 4,6-dehydratase [Crateriforma conspicua]|uniref:CDP-glucose 4,6-dehydratase n=1 Tax=Crateriforma conspicua TaxID=2527996 RepID=UPI00118BAEB6|nr:CDP-glucose 4,6-dehydratase [Crateriforma conspicua]QDV61218.1 CDP-glucose 4,6-dehydratase [Crateriforma conspicua]
MSKDFSGCFGGVFNGQDVLVTGHTGFKGGWLCHWLAQCGARVHGLAMDPDDGHSLFATIQLTKDLAGDHRGNIADRQMVSDLVREIRPRYLFHLAAQPLVRQSYQCPVETFETNVMGTVNVLDALRSAGHRCNVVVVTTDKCYRNREWVNGYREDDPLGGHDPYSASKAGAEIVTSAYRDSFFRNSPIRMASVRAGNVIGGGDWAADRLVPDCIRALTHNEEICVRNRHSTRPWQHVLEPLSGYLHLASRLEMADDAAPFTEAFNFGPPLASNRSVLDLVKELIRYWPGRWRDATDPNAVHEAALLNLAIDKAHHTLGWTPVWDFQQTVCQTAVWYQTHHAGEDIRAFTTEQIRRYVCDASNAGLCWTGKRAVQRRAAA